ncbi:Uncharacterised protein [Candidatus Burarchaeum australiense]|nr:Uncharacterised protein [Candidatus Burarchaeum australiense]
MAALKQKANELGAELLECANKRTVEAELKAEDICSKLAAIFTVLREKEPDKAFAFEPKVEKALRIAENCGGWPE